MATDNIAMKLLFVIALLVCLNSATAAPKVGIASFYGDELRGRLQANGKPFNPDALTCASWYHPLGTKLRVTNISNGRTVLVTVTDRGPAKRLKRIIDLSRAAYQSIDNLDNGLCTVQIERLNK